MIKAYIFDQEGTLYPKKSNLTDALRERTKEWLSESLSVAEQKLILFMQNCLKIFHTTITDFYL